MAGFTGQALRSYTYTYATYQKLSSGRQFWNNDALLSLRDRIKYYRPCSGSSISCVRKNWPSAAARRDLTAIDSSSHNNESHIDPHPAAFFLRHRRNNWRKERSESIKHPRGSAMHTAHNEVSIKRLLGLITTWTSLTFGSKSFHSLYTLFYRPHRFLQNLHLAYTDPSAQSPTSSTTKPPRLREREEL